MIAQMTGSGQGLCLFMTEFVFYRHQNGDPNGLATEAVMQKLKDKEIHLLACKITDKTNKMIQHFAKHYNDGVKHELVAKSIFGNQQVEFSSTRCSQLCSVIAQICLFV